MAKLPASIEGLVRSRRVRLALALTVLALSGWAFLPHLVYRIAPTAFVNAELVRVTAPMAGRLARDLPRKGDMIDHSITVNLTETGDTFRILSSKGPSQRTVQNLPSAKLLKSRRSIVNSRSAPRLIKMAWSNALTRRSSKQRLKKPVASRRSTSAALSAPECKNWSDQDTPRKSAQPRPQLHKKPTPRDVK